MNKLGVDTKGNTPGSNKEPGVGWMDDWFSYTSKLCWTFSVGSSKKVVLHSGVVIVVSGFGAALCIYMHVDKAQHAFTGSTATGKVVFQLASISNLEPVSIELGGKSHFIVFEDVDVDKAVELAHIALFFN